MKRVLCVILLVLLMCCVTVVLSEEISYFETLVSDVKILFNEKEVEFELPVITVNNSIYIPLRESAEKIGINVEWDEKNKEVLLDKNDSEKLITSIINRLFEIDLPDSLEILKYDYFTEHGEEYLSAKILLNEKSKEFIKNTLVDNYSIYPFKGCNENSIERVIENNAKKYDWWEWKNYDNGNEIYFTSKAAVNSKRLVEIYCGFVEQNNQNYLYISYH